MPHTNENHIYLRLWRKIKHVHRNISQLWRYQWDILLIMHPEKYKLFCIRLKREFSCSNLGTDELCQSHKHLHYCFSSVQPPHTSSIFSKNPNLLQKERKKESKRSPASKLYQKQPPHSSTLLWALI